MFYVRSSRINICCLNQVCGAPPLLSKLIEFPFQLDGRELFYRNFIRESFHFLRAAIIKLELCGHFSFDEFEIVNFQS